jgi:hypothetical protein
MNDTRACASCYAMLCYAILAWTMLLVGYGIILYDDDPS